MVPVNLIFLMQACVMTDLATVTNTVYGVRDASADLKRIQRWLSALGATCRGSVGRPEGSLFTGKQNCSHALQVQRWTPAVKDETAMLTE